MKKRIVWILFIAYCFFILWYTVFSRDVRQTQRVFKPEFFWAFKALAAGRPEGKTESIQYINNILFFIPFGILFPKRKWLWVLVGALTFSCLIEVTQYCFNFGWAEIDDVICNVLGALIGFWIILVLEKHVKRDSEIKCRGGHQK